MREQDRHFVQEFLKNWFKFHSVVVLEDHSTMWLRIVVMVSKPSDGHRAGDYVQLTDDPLDFPSEQLCASLRLLAP